MNRPLTTVILAMTADGKIADFQRSPARFSSTVDKAHLEKQISLVDGVLFGAGTLRAYGTTLPLSNPKLLFAREQEQKPPQPIHIICSASAQIDPQLRFFHQPVPRWLLTTRAGAKFWQESQQEGFERILVADAGDEECGEQLSVISYQLSVISELIPNHKPRTEEDARAEPASALQASVAQRHRESKTTPHSQSPVTNHQSPITSHQSPVTNHQSPITNHQSPITNHQSIDWVDALAQLKELGLHKLGILGGGELVASLLAMDLIDEFWLTVCPVILGGATAPTPVEGIGFSDKQARHLELLSMEQIEGEIFLHYKLQR